MLADMNEGIRHAYKRLQVISQDDEKRREYDARMKALRDYNQGMLDAREEGREEGRKEGSNNRALNIAKNLVLANIPMDIIINSTGLSEKEINALK